MIPTVHKKIQPPAEYLQVLDELLECRDDEELNRVRAKLQHVLDGRLFNIRNRTFIERYNSFEASIHVHGTARRRLSPDCFFNFCAFIQRVPASATNSIVVGNTFFRTDSFGQDVQVSVFVDVREFLDDFQCVNNSEPARTVDIVRLYALDECVRRNGNPRQISKEPTRKGKSIGNGRFSFSCGGNVNQEGELAVLAPSFWQDHSSGIQLDQIECQVVEGRAELIENFASDNRDFGGRVAENTNLLFAIRLRDDFARITSGISPNAFFDNLDMFRCPGEFETDGFRDGSHAEGESIAFDDLVSQLYYCQN